MDWAVYCTDCKRLMPFPHGNTFRTSDGTLAQRIAVLHRDLYPDHNIIIGFYLDEIEKDDDITTVVI